MTEALTDSALPSSTDRHESRASCLAIVTVTTVIAHYHGFECHQPI
jgi:hypothetical protein